jgi:UDP-glucose 4-epimerase
MEMYKWVIVGGFGFIGSRLAKLLLDQGHDVVIIDDVSFTPWAPTVHRYREKRYEFDFRTKIKHTISLPALQIVQKSVRDPKVDLSEYEADFIVVAHGPSIPKQVQREPISSRNNMMGSLEVILDSAITQPNLKNIVFLSSSMVYGNFGYTPIKEDHPTNPLEAYGIYKLTCEHMLRSYHHLHNVPYTILRLSGVYGPGDGNGRVIETLIDNALKGIPLTVRDSRVDFTHVDDVVDGIIRAAYRCKSDTYNLSSGRSAAISEVAEYIAENLIFGTEINYTEEESWRPERGALNIEKAQKTFQYDPRHKWEIGVDAYFEYLKRRQELIYGKIQ